MPTPFRIEITDEQDRLPADPERLRAVAEDVLRHEGVAAAEVSVAVIDGETMRRLNREHLGHDDDTDVLSFLLDGDAPAGTGESGRGAGRTLDGEVLLGADTALRTAAEFGWSGGDELVLYLVHGLLHLVGYDDLTETEKAVMRRREREHLARWGLTPTYAEDGDEPPPSGDRPAGAGGRNIV